MKKWLIERFLPMWAKETLCRENRLLYRKNRELEQKLRVLEAYARGLEMGLRAVRRRTAGGEA